MKNNIDRFLNRVLYSLYNLMYFSILTQKFFHPYNVIPA